MNRLILFIKRIYVPVLFIILEIAALNYYASSSNYTRARLLTASNYFVGGIHKGFSDVGDYFGLRSENDRLLARIAELENKLDVMKNHLADEEGELFHENEYGTYSYTVASVINNSITRQQNYITIDKGMCDGVRINMALLTPEGGIAGYIVDCSDKMAVAISVLNTEFRIGGQIQGKEDFFGSIQWDGLDYEHVTLKGMPKYAELSKGDTIVTVHSLIFPPDVVIGTVEDYQMTQTWTYEAKVRLRDHLGALKRVLIVNYADLQERLLLEEDNF